MRQLVLLLAPRHWIAWLVAEVVLAALLSVWGSVLVQFPLTLLPAPLSYLFRVAVIFCAIIPLCQHPPEFARYLSREPTLRAVRPLAAFGLASVGMGLPLALGSVTREDGTFVAVLFALGVVLVVLIGDYAWMPVAGLGLGALFISAVPGHPLTVFLQSVPVEVTGVMCVFAMALYAWRGARVSAAAE